MAKRAKVKYHLGYNEEGFYFLCTEGAKYEVLCGPAMETNLEVINRLKRWPSCATEEEEEDGGEEAFPNNWWWSVPKEFL